MKKSTLLSFATAAAIIATSAGTFAAWDNTTANASLGSIKFDKIDVTTTGIVPLAEDSTIIHGDGVNPKANGEFSVDLSSVPSADINKVELTLTPKVTVNNAAVNSADYNVTIKKNGATDALANNTDTTLTSDANNKYTVELEAKNATTLGDKDIQVDVEATLTEKPDA